MAWKREAMPEKEKKSWFDIFLSYLYFNVPCKYEWKITISLFTEHAQ